MKRNGFDEFIIIFIFVFVCCFNSVFSFENTSEAKSRQEITDLLKKWPQDFNAKNIQATCGLFAPDLVASYPESQDKNYDEMCRFLETAFQNKDKNFTYEAPQIEQIFIDGDIGVVRLIWQLKIVNKKTLKTEWIKEKGLDVFKRQKDGSWKIAISYAFPLN